MIRAKGTDQRRRRGVVAVQLAVTLTVLPGFAALTVDVGRMYNAKQELQRGASALPGGAALEDRGTVDKCGAPVLPRDFARAEAQRFAQENGWVLWGALTNLVRSEDPVFGWAAYDPANDLFEVSRACGVGKDLMELTAEIGVDQYVEAQSSIDDFSDQAQEVFGLLGCTKSVEVIE